MKIENINCEYLSIYSVPLESAILNNTLHSVKIAIGVNHKKTFNAVLKPDDVDIGMSTEIMFTDDTVITQICLKNIFTGQEYELIDGGNEYHVNNHDLMILSAHITTKINDDLGIPDVHVTFTTSSSILTITIDGLPPEIIVDKVFYRTLGVSLSSTFSSSSQDNIIVSGGTIYFPPSFFDAENLVDGIYTIIVEVNLTNGMTAIEEACYFVDCISSQKLIDTIDVDLCKDVDTDLVLLHYSLTQASNNECDCEQMQKVFDYLWKNLNVINTDSCGC